jgi:putative DNA primase/helicase
MAKEKGLKKFSPRPYSKILQANYTIRCDKNSILWLYISDTGLWSNNGEKLIEQILRERYLKSDVLSNHHVREIISDIKSLRLRNKEFPAPLWHQIPFNNGVYNLKTKEFREFSPEDNCTSKLEVNYNPEGKGCTFIDKIFHQFVKPEDVTDLYELVSYCMVPSYANQEFFFIYGPGRNGKSVFVNVITSMLGKKNVSAASLHSLQSDKFAGADLYGKFANVDAELRYNDLVNTDLLKKLTGNDYIRAQEKFKPSFNFFNYAKLIFVTNELPRTTDKSEAFYRRVRIIHFPYTFKADREDKLLSEKITRQELEGLAFKCVEILCQMISRNFTFTKPKDTLDVEKTYENISNPVVTFMEESCKEDADGFILKSIFKIKLDAWLRSNGHRIRDDKEIIQYMREKGISDKKLSLGKAIRQNSWVGITWR